MNRIVPGSVWNARRQYGIQTLHFNQDLEKWVMHGAGLDNIVDIRAGDLIQFLDHKMRGVYNERMRREEVEPIVTMLLLKDMKKVTIGVKTSTYWENWWLENFELVSK